MRDRRKEPPANQCRSTTTLFSEVEAAEEQAKKSDSSSLKNVRAGGQKMIGIASSWLATGAEDERRRRRV